MNWENTKAVSWVTDVSNANANRDTLSLRRSLPYQKQQHAITLWLFLSREKRSQKWEKELDTCSRKKNLRNFCRHFSLHALSALILHHVVPSALLHVRCSAVNICINGPFFLLPSLRRKRHCHCCILRRVDNLARIARSPSRFSSPHPHRGRASFAGGDDLLHDKVSQSKRSVRCMFFRHSWTSKSVNLIFILTFTCIFFTQSSSFSIQDESIQWWSDQDAMSNTTATDTPTRNAKTNRSGETKEKKERGATEWTTATSFMERASLRECTGAAAASYRLETILLTTWLRHSNACG